MRSWEVNEMDLRPHAPEILSSTDDARAIVLEIPAGEGLTDHQVHERAWVTVLEGEVEITSDGGGQATGGPGLVVEFDPRERHALQARTRVLILLLLTPWPGDGHPGARSLEDKERAREHAAQHRPPE
jgi:quercetin dioxygenase-like cupin family protein